MPASPSPAASAGASVSGGAHREHFYQRALGPSGDHAAVAGMILGGDTVLVLLALLAVAQPLAGLALAVLAVAALLALLERRARHGG